MAKNKNVIGQKCIDPFGNLIKSISQVNELDSITCNKCDSTNKSLNKLNAMENKFDICDLFTNGENYQGITSSGEFKVTTQNPLLSKQMVTSKRNPST